MQPGPPLEGRQLATLRLSDLNENASAVVYDELLKPAFPATELMTREEFDDARLHGACDGWVLMDADVPVAACVTEEYVDGRVRLLAYLVVMERARGHRLGEHLLRVIARPPAAPVLLAEIEDPRFHPTTATNDPEARLRFYARNGCRLLPLDYFQPSLRAGSPRVPNLLLIVLQPPTGELDGALVTAFLDEYFMVCEGEDARDDAAYAALTERARGEGTGTLTAHPLSDLRAARPAAPAPDLRPS